MTTNQPITTAVYGPKRGGKKPAKKPARKPQVNSLVGSLLGDEAVASLYRSLGFKQPRPDRRKRRG